MEEKGYLFEVHNILTVDGYKLVYHRVGSKHWTSAVSRQPVLLQHGLGMSSAAFLTPDTNSLGEFRRVDIMYFYVDTNFIYLYPSRI